MNQIQSFLFKEIGLSRIPDQPLLPTFSDKVQHELLMGLLIYSFSHIIDRMSL